MCYIYQVKTWLYVVIGGAIGTGLRFGINLLLKPDVNSSFPLNTLVINITGCLLIGLAFAYLKKVTPSEQLLIAFFTTGVLGGFTTFSAYAIETAQLFEARKGGTAVIYMLLTNVFGLMAAWLGYNLHKVWS